MLPLLLHLISFSHMLLSGLYSIFSPPVYFKKEPKFDLRTAWVKNHDSKYINRIVYNFLSFFPYRFSVTLTMSSRVSLPLKWLLRLVTVVLGRGPMNPDKGNKRRGACYR